MGGSGMPRGCGDKHVATGRAGTQDVTWKQESESFVTDLGNFSTAHAVGWANLQLRCAHFRTT